MHAFALIVSLLAMCNPLDAVALPGGTKAVISRDAYCEYSEFILCFTSFEMQSGWLFHPC